MQGHKPSSSVWERRNDRVGAYELIRSLGEGGMAEVFLARGPAGEHVALKRLAARCGADGPAMMLREANLALRLVHPNVVRTYGFSEREHYIVMEFVPGRNAADIIGRAEERGTLLSLDASLSLVHAIAQGLHAAHEATDEHGGPLGLVHRDVTPSNILVAVDGTPKLSDFGIAKATMRADATYGGPLKGKMGYMSPEQCRCEPLDRRSDIFGLGVILFELTVGCPMVQCPTALGSMVVIANGDYPRPRDIHPGYPAELDEIVARATAVRPEHRYATARELKLDLDAFAYRHGLELSPQMILRGLDRLFDHDDEGPTEVFGLSEDTGEGLIDATRRASYAPDGVSWAPRAIPSLLDRSGTLVC